MENQSSPYSAERAVAHPSCALMVTFGLVISLLMTSSPVGIIYLLILFLVSLRLARLSLKVIGREVSRVWPFLVLTFAFHMLLSGRNMANLVDVSIIHIGWSSIATAVVFTGRLAIVIGVMVGLFALFPPSEIAREVARWLRTVPIGRRSLAQIELLMTLALRFVPALGKEAQRLRLAAAARGHVDEGFTGRIRSWRKITFPLVVNSFRRADHVSLALRARGYDPNVRRSRYLTYPFRRGECAVAALLLVASFAAPWL